MFAQHLLNFPMTVTDTVPYHPVLMWLVSVSVSDLHSLLQVSFKPRMMAGHTAVLGGTEGAEHSYILTLLHPVKREEEDGGLQKEIPYKGPDVK